MIWIAVWPPSLSSCTTGRVYFATTVLLLRHQQGASSMEAIIRGNLIAAPIGLPYMFDGPAPDAMSWLGLALPGVFQLGIFYGACSPYATSARWKTC